MLEPEKTGLMQSNSVLLGIIGPPGCGKSTLATAMKNHGGIIIDADREGHDLLEIESIRNQLIDEFGSDMITSGTVNRSVLSCIVTEDRASMERFNRIIHPPLLERIADKVFGVFRTCSGRIPIVDAALIPEWEIVSFFDLLVYVYCPKSIRIRRLELAGKNTVAIERLAAYQNPDHVKRAVCHVVVDNTGTREDLERKGAALIRCMYDMRKRGEGEEPCQKKLWTVSGMHRND
jgi:dephospho-CoA kinase